VRHQAEAYLAWERRAGLPRAVAWRTWVASKMFGPGDVAAIEAEVRRIRIQRAAETFVERHSA
jgi:hypothetical protein